jgi:hypothetical protein
VLHPAGRAHTAKIKSRRIRSHDTTSSANKRMNNTTNLSDRPANERHSAGGSGEMGRPVRKEKDGTCVTSCPFRM